LRPGRAPAVLASLALGSLTHLAWDAFTHPDGYAVRALPILRHLLFTISGYRVFVFKVLQHGSTVVGVALLVAWTVQWFGRTAPGASAPDGLSPRARILVISGLAGTALLCAGFSAARVLPARVTLEALRPVVFHAIVAGGACVAFGVL